MSRRSSSNSPISLFPFLDTLVCTMGSLILMLLAVMPKIRERAEARQLERDTAVVADVQEVAEAAAEAPAAAVPAVVPALDSEELEQKRELRRKNREAWQKAADEQRESLARRTAELHKLRERLKEARAWVRDADEKLVSVEAKSDEAGKLQRSLSDAEADLREQEALIAQKIAQTRKNIDLANRKQADAPNEYALVPYDGASGTVRRPIYIECNARGFRFVAENENLGLNELSGFTNTFNPLLQGTQALIRYWAQKRRQSQGEEPEPYVLLLVRPGGIDAYYQARSNLAALGANFGYELIDEDFKVAAPKTDPAARSRLKDAIDATIETREKLGEALARRSGYGNWGSDRFDDGNDVLFGGPGGSGGGGGTGAGGPGGGLPGNTGGKKGGRPSIQLGTPTRPYRDSPRVAQSGEEGDDPSGSGIGSGSSGGSSGAKNPSQSKPTAMRSSTGAGPGTGSGKSRSGVASAKPADLSGRGGIGTGNGALIGGGPGAFGDGDSLTGRAGGSTPGGFAFGSGARPGSGTRPGSRSGSPFGANGTGIGSGLGPDGEQPGSGDGSDDDLFRLDSEGPGAGHGPGSGRGGPGGGGAKPATLDGSGLDSKGTGGGNGNGLGDSGNDEPPLLLPQDAIGQLPALRGPAEGSGGGGGSGGGSSSGGKSYGAHMQPVPGGDPADEETALELPLLGTTPDDGGSGGAMPGGSGGGRTTGKANGARRGSSRSGSSSGPSDSSSEDGSDAGDPNAGSSGASSSLLGSPPAGAPSSSVGLPLPVQMGGPGLNMKLGSGGQKGAPGKDGDNGPRLPEDDSSRGGRQGRSRGPRLWGQARSKATAGYTRKIEIRILSDRIMVHSTDAVVYVGNDETVQEMVNAVVARIEQRAQQWGEPPEGFYWAPKIKFVVYKGGDQYYRTLHRALETEWELPSTVEYVVDKPAQTGPRKTGGPSK